MMWSFPAGDWGTIPGRSPLIHKSSISWSSLVKSYWARPPVSLQQQDPRTSNTFDSTTRLNVLLLVHLLCRDQLQHPVNPDLLDPSMGGWAHVGQVQLLVGAQVKLVGLGVRERGAKHKQERGKKCIYRFTICWACSQTELQQLDV